jgi:hypothetical protein
MGGKWWGGYYGWRWPHGYHHLMEAVLIAASNALLLTGDDSWLDFPRSQMDRIYELGREERGAWVAPHHHGDNGWYGYHPLNPTHAIHLWSLSQTMDDHDRVERIRAGAEWTRVEDHRGKGEYNHAMPWYAYVQGDNPHYPEEIMNFTFREMRRRLDAIRKDEGSDPAAWDVHHWQDRNPVGTEALTQLTLGAPHTLYHGGLLHASVRYFDPVSRRSGLPEDVAACVETVKAKSVTLSLSNVSPLEDRRVLIQAGAFGEHGFTGATIENGFQNHQDALFGNRGVGKGRYKTVEIALEAGTTIRLRLNLQRYVNRPGYDFPWDAESLPFQEAMLSKSAFSRRDV